MSKQFTAKAVYRLDGPVLDLVPAGTIVCVDARGDWFKNIMTADADLDLGTQKLVYKARKTGTRLYRDFWRCLPWDPTSSAGKTLRDVPKTCLSH